MTKGPPPPGRFEASLRNEPNELRRKMLLLGYISQRLARTGGRLFLVGGQAVETYTGGTFTTGDIDVTTTDRDGTEDILARLGFAREGMIWLNERLGMAVHVVASYPSWAARARRIEVGGYQVSVVGVEDLIVDRLNAAKHWKSERDAEQAAALLRAFEGDLDEAYLDRRAKDDLVGDALKKARGSRSRKARRGSSQDS